jgi:hypothetical protein
VAGTWTILRSTEYAVWYESRLTVEEQDAIVAVALRLQVEGPALRRPLSGQIQGSRFKNMKELIPARGNIRIVYVFDPKRRAIFLFGGDKTDDWTEWYDANITIADAIYERHLESEGLATKNRSSRKPGGRKR